MIPRSLKKETGKFSRVGFSSSRLPETRAPYQGIALQCRKLVEIRHPPLGGWASKTTFSPGLPVIISSITEEVRPFAVSVPARKPDDIFRERNPGEKSRHKSPPSAVGMKVTEACATTDRQTTEHRKLVWGV
jgi:hypothetical protein